MSRKSLSLVGVLLSLPLAVQANFSSQPGYTSAAQNPLTALGPSWLENFEGAPVAGYAASGGLVQSPSALTDSVDADDGNVDGFGTQGRSFLSNTSSIDFSFNATPLGALPTAVGIALTDVGAVAGTAPCVGSNATLQVFGAAGNLLGQTTLAFNSLGSCAGESADDVFLSWQGTQGVGLVRIAVAGSTDWEVDHLTAALASPIPEPGSAALMLLGVAALGRRRPGAPKLAG